MRIALPGNNGAGGDGGCVPPPRLVRAAQEFEGQMMKELLKPVSDSEQGGWLGSQEDGAPVTGGILSEFAGEALGQALSRRGGFGIADRIIGQLQHSGIQCRQETTKPVPDSEIRSSESLK